MCAYACVCVCARLVVERVPGRGTCVFVSVWMC